MKPTEFKRLLADVHVLTAEECLALFMRSSSISRPE
jgi:hypothetical protein